MKKAVFAVLVAALGCRTPQHPQPSGRYVKEGATAEDLERDRSVCAEGARSYRSTREVWADKIEQCMKAKGWRVRDEGPPQGAAPRDGARTTDA